MRNRILSLTRASIPYVKELRPLAGSVVGCLLMQQLDYWFARYPDGFFKFLEPMAQEKFGYVRGQSWQEELGISLDEFRGAFDRIGVRYRSKTEYQAARDADSPFIREGREYFYCSYLDRVSRRTYYSRNHAKVDAELDRLTTSSGPSLRDGDFPSLEMGISHLSIHTEITEEIKENLLPTSLSNTNYARSNSIERMGEGEGDLFDGDLPTDPAPTSSGRQKVTKRQYPVNTAQGGYPRGTKRDIIISEGTQPDIRRIAFERWWASYRSRVTDGGYKVKGPKEKAWAIFEKIPKSKYQTLADGTRKYMAARQGPMDAFRFLRGNPAPYEEWAEVAEVEPDERKEGQADGQQRASGYWDRERENRDALAHYFRTGEITR